MNKQQKTRIWSRTTKALGKFFAAMVTLPEDPRKARQWNDYPHFPPY